MLAIVVVAITLMLNNVIYSSNMAYVGYMDQSRYDDLSYKQATAYEATFAYTNDSTNYDNHMNDYAKCLNNLSSAKGGFIELISNSYGATPSTNPFPITNTKSQLSIYGKDSKTSYLIYTGSSNTATPTPTPTATPLPTSYNLLLSADKYSFDYGNNGVSNLSVKVTDSGGMIQPNVYVTFTLSDSSIGGLIQMDGLTQIPPNGLKTDQYGYVYAKFVDGYHAGTETITAYNGTKNISNSINIVITQPATCTHTVPAPTITIKDMGNKKYTIKLQFDFSGFTNGNVIVNTYSYSDNMQLDSNPPVYHSKDGYIDVTIKRKDNDNTQFSMTFNVEVTAICNIDNQPYDKTVTYTVTGP
jgi:hypothetical protein